jgi:hypothetical protein
MEFELDTALWVAVAAPVVVIGWSMAFAAKAALSGPAWALSHLRLATPALIAFTIGGVVTAMLFRPAWVGLAVLYPFAVGTWMAAARQRQLAFVERDGGFGEIDPNVRYRVGRGLSRSLRIAGAVAWFAGLGLVAWGLAQGWLIVALGPIAIAIGWLVDRRNPDPLR